MLAELRSSAARPGAGDATVERAGYDANHKVFLFQVAVNVWLKRCGAPQRAPARPTRAHRARSMSLSRKRRVYIIGVWNKDAAARWVRCMCVCVMTHVYDPHRPPSGGSDPTRARLPQGANRRSLAAVRWPLAA